jgi:hypothetical protein
MRINFVALSFRSVMMSPKRRKPDSEADNTVLCCAVLYKVLVHAFPVR